MVQPLRMPAPALSDGPCSAPLEQPGAAVRARTPGTRPHPASPGAGSLPAPGIDDLDRLRRQVNQQRLALIRLTDALLALRRGTAALREENRELRRELDAATRPPRGPGGLAAS